MPYIKLFTDFGATFDLLSDAEAGRLIKAILHYANGQEATLTGQERLVYAMLKTQIDRDAASYQQFCDKQRENGSKGGRPKKPTETQENPNNPTVISKTQKSQDKEKEKEEEKEENKENKKRDIAHEKAKAQLELFNQFWAAYPRKTAKQDAVKAFAKLNATPELLEIMLKAIEKQMVSHQWSDPQYIPHPATWLNGHRWEDEVVKGAGKNIAQTNYTQREYEEPKQGQLPAWLVEEIEAEDREKKAYFVAHGLEDTAENRKRLTRIKGEWVYNADAS